MTKSYSEIVTSRVSGPSGNGWFDYTCPAPGCDRRGWAFLRREFAEASLYNHLAECHPNHLPEPEESL